MANDCSVTVEAVEVVGIVEVLVDVVDVVGVGGVVVVVVCVESVGGTSPSRRCRGGRRPNTCRRFRKTIATISKTSRAASPRKQPPIGRASSTRTSENMT